MESKEGGADRGARGERNKIADLREHLPTPILSLREQSGGYSWLEQLTRNDPKYTKRLGRRLRRLRRGEKSILK